jgi:hypothetical protein
MRWETLKRQATSAVAIGAGCLLVFGTGVATAATGGGFVLGRSNYESSPSSLSNTAATGGPALRLHTAKSSTPNFAVSNSTKIPHLNADLLDGLSSSAFQHRLASSCSAGSAISGVSASGVVTCVAIPLGGATSIDALAGTPCAGVHDPFFPGSFAGTLQVGYDYGSEGVTLVCTSTLRHLKLTYYIGFSGNTSSVTLSSPTDMSCSPTGSACGIWVPETAGSGVTLTVNPGPGVTGWTWGGACSGSATTCDVVMDSQLMNVSITFTGS